MFHKILNTPLVCLVLDWRSYIGDLLIIQFLWAPFLVITFPWWLSIMQLSELVILGSASNVIWLSWLLNFNIIFDTLWIATESELWLKILKELNLFHLIVQISTVYRCQNSCVSPWWKSHIKFTLLL